MSAVSITPSGTWWNSDGSWSIFNIAIGTPAYTLATLFSTSLSLPYLIWDTSNSTSWTQYNTSDIDVDNYLGYSFDAIYGYENLGIGNISTGFRQQIAITTGLDPNSSESLFQSKGGFSFLGLYPQQSSSGSPSGLLQAMKDVQVIPSLSWAYNAGSARRSMLGSLTLGGYDAAKMGPGGISYNMTNDDSHYLSANLSAITINTNPGANPDALLPSPITVNLDSNFPFMELPETICDSFAQRLNLTYNDTFNVYTLSNDTANTLIEQDTRITFTMIDNNNSVKTVDIQFLYEEFWWFWQYGPGYLDHLMYFPIRRAANASQYTLGRMFMQEAYIIADFERKNFTIAPRVETTDTELRSIAALPVSASTTPSNTTSSTAGPVFVKSHSLSGGATAGIVVGSVMGVLLIALLVFFLIRRRKRVCSVTRDPLTRKPSVSTYAGSDEREPPQRRPELDSTAAPAPVTYNSAYPSRLDGTTAVTYQSTYGSELNRTTPVTYPSAYPSELSEGNVRQWLETPQRYELETPAENPMELQGVFMLFEVEARDTRHELPA